METSKLAKEEAMERLRAHCREDYRMSPDVREVIRSSLKHSPFTVDEASFGDNKEELEKAKIVCEEFNRAREEMMAEPYSGR
jgi:hypothetical protein